MEGREVGNTERNLGCFLRQCTEVENTGNNRFKGEDRQGFANSFQNEVWKTQTSRSFISRSGIQRRGLHCPGSDLFATERPLTPLRTEWKWFFSLKKNVPSYIQDFVSLLRGFTYFPKDTLQTKNLWYWRHVSQQQKPNRSSPSGWEGGAALSSLGLGLTFTWPYADPLLAVPLPEGWGVPKPRDALIQILGNR